MGIGTKLSELMEANGTNANELAKKIGVSPQTIYSMIKRDSKKQILKFYQKLLQYLEFQWNILLKKKYAAHYGGAF